VLLARTRACGLGHDHPGAPPDRPLPGHRRPDAADSGRRAAQTAPVSVRAEVGRVAVPGRHRPRSRRPTQRAGRRPGAVLPGADADHPPLAGRRAVLDGEIVVLRHGRPDFDAISGRLAARRLADWAARTSPACGPCGQRVAASTAAGWSLTCCAAPETLSGHSRRLLILDVLARERPPGTPGLARTGAERPLPPRSG
jgi:hypothetical protein